MRLAVDINEMPIVNSLPSLTPEQAADCVWITIDAVTFLRTTLLWKRILTARIRSDYNADAVGKFKCTGKNCHKDFAIGEVV